MTDQPTPADPSVEQPGLPDVTDMSMLELLHSGDPDLAAGVRRLADGVATKDEPISAFANVQTAPVGRSADQVTDESRQDPGS